MEGEGRGVRVAPAERSASPGSRPWRSLVYAFTVVHLTDRSLYRWQLAAVSLLSLVADRRRRASGGHDGPIVLRIAAAGGHRQALVRRLPVELADLGAVRRLRRIMDPVHLGDVVDGRGLRVLLHLHRDADPQGCTATVVRPATRCRLVDADHRRRGGRWSSSSPRSLRSSRRSSTSIVLPAATNVSIDIAKVQAAAHDRHRATGERRQPDDRCGGGAGTTLNSTAPTVATVAPVQPPGPARLVIVGDSQAHALAINLPSGIESAFTISDGSVEGCSVYDDGKVRSQRSQLQPIVRRLRRLGRQVGQGGQQGPSPDRPRRARRVGRVRRRGRLAS